MSDRVSLHEAGFTDIPMRGFDRDLVERAMSDEFEPLVIP